MTSPLHRQLDNGNGHHLSSHWFHPAGEARGVVLIVPAMGVEQRFYAAFAQWLAERGFVTVTFDYVGMGLSRQGPLRDLQVDVIGWGRHDCSAMLDAAAAAAGSLPVFWIGHSLGGVIMYDVLTCFAPDVEVAIATGSGYWRENTRSLRNRAWLLWYLIAPLVTPLAGYFPGQRLGMVGDLPRGVIEQWRRWCLHPEYAVGAEGETVREAYSAVRTPITAISFTDDEMMSGRNTESLHGFYRAAPQTAKRIAPTQIGVERIGHFGFFRRQFAESLWAPYLLPDLG